MGEGMGPGPSLLWEQALREAPLPAYFHDLHLDELESLVFSPHEGHNLEAIFRTPLVQGEGVRFRQEVARELEAGGDVPLRGLMAAMDGVRAKLALAEKARHPWQERFYFLQAAKAYAEGVEGVGRAWEGRPPQARGLLGYAAHLRAYRASAGFRRLREEGEAVWEALKRIRYVLHVHEGRLVLRAFQGEPDYGERVVETFRAFFGSSPPRFAEPGGMSPPWLNHIEEWILDHLALLFPQAFGLLEAFHREHQGFVDEVVARLEREARFFLAYLDFIAPLRAAGLPFAYPEPAPEPPLCLEEGFDLVLGARLVARGERPVANGFHLGEERILVVSGPNQGGKTTFARMVGQAHHLFALGFPVPGRRARLSLPDRILTHFEARENPEDLRSKLEVDLVRLKDLLDAATDRSLLLLNEPLASAALQDARTLGRFLLERVRAKGSLAVLVTFLEELARLPGTRSLVAEVDPSDPARRTFRIVERPADGKAYALALAAKHGLTYEALRARIGGGS